MKKQYIFLSMILAVLYILYLILSKSYYEYKINAHIESINQINNSIKKSIAKAEEIINYKSSRAYKNKVLKEQQSFKNKGETVVYLTTQSKYEKFTHIESSNEKNNKINNEKLKESDNIINDMSINEKWLYLIFKKDTY